MGSAPVAAVSLAISGLCCLVFAVGWRALSPTAFLALLFLWGAAVVRGLSLNFRLYHGPGFSR